MGLRDMLSRRKALRASPDVVEGLADRRITPYPALGGTNIDLSNIRDSYVRMQSASYGWIYRTQPQVRTVIDFIARNTAQLGLKLYERVEDTEREERGEHPAAETMENPNEFTTGEHFIFGFVADFLVFDNAYALKLRGSRGGPLTLLGIPPESVGVVGPSRFSIDAYRIYRTDGTFFDVPPGDVLHMRGYDPEDPRMGVSKLETLRLELAEAAASQSANVELMKSGLNVPGVIERPLEAPQWSEEGRKRFQEAFANQAKQQGRHYPVLEEGMSFAQVGVSPKDAQMLDSRKFTLAQVARIYGVPPGLLGLEMDDLEQQHRQFYADVLPPLTEQIAAFLDLSLLRGEFSEPDLYFEFNLDEKLRGNLEEKLKTMVSVAGAPFMTRNEVRAMQNLPPLDEADELITPLNVTEGGKPSPVVMPPQDPLGPSQDGDHREQSFKQLEPGSTVPRREADFARQHRYAGEATSLLEGFYTHQLQSVKSKGLFDSERWNRNLSEKLEKLIRSIVEREGGIYTARLGGDDFDSGQTKNYVEAMAVGLAERMNAATQRDFEGDSTAREAAERAQGQRAAVAGTQIGASSTLFARQEAAKQAPHPERRVQIWVSNTDRHANLDGAVVPLGSDWGGIEPGSEPNCGCSAIIE